MALTRYKVLEADVAGDGSISIPKKSTVIGVKYRFPIGKPFLVFIMRYDDWADEFPEEAKAEEEAEAKGGKEKGAEEQQKASTDVK